MLAVLEFLSHGPSPPPSSLCWNEWRSVFLHKSHVLRLTLSQPWWPGKPAYILSAFCYTRVCLHFSAIKKSSDRIIPQHICWEFDQIESIDMRALRDVITACWQKSRYLYPNQKQILMGWFRQNELWLPGEFQPSFQYSWKLNTLRGKRLSSEMNRSTPVTSQLFLSFVCAAVPPSVSNGCFHPSHEFASFPCFTISLMNLSDVCTVVCYCRWLELKTFKVNLTDLINI